VGRHDEVDEVVRLLWEGPLLTLTGPPGVGKSRLAREVVACRNLASPGPTWFVDIAGVASPADLARAVADAVGVDEDDPAPDVIVGHVGQRTALLVLDNSEHLTGAVAELVEVLLDRCPNLTMLATSRERLDVGAESVWCLGPLAVPARRDDPDPDRLLAADAVQLFCVRAATARPGFVLTAETAPFVADICRRLDGLPLAIELAAERVALLSPAEIADQLDDRFALLHTSGHVITSPHPSLDAALEHSHERLSVAEQAVWRRLSVFVGGATLDAAQEVCSGGEAHVDEMLDLLQSLVGKSLVVAEITCGSARFRQLESLRLFGSHKLARTGEAASVRARHAGWCFDFLNEGASRLGRATRHTWLARMDAEDDNLGAALRWSLIEGRRRLAVGLVGRLVPYWWARGRYRHALGHLAQVLCIADRVPAPLHTKLLCDAGLLSIMLGDLDAARSHAEQALAQARERGDVRGTVESLKLAGFVTGFVGDPGGGLQRLDEAVALARRSGDTSALANCLAARARVRLFSGDALAGRSDFAEATALGRDAADLTATANGLIGAGWAALALADYAEAEGHLEDGLALASDIPDRHGTALALAWLGELERLRGHDERAQARFADSAALARELETPYPLARALLGLGRLAAGAGDVDEAGRFFDEALAVAKGHDLAHLVSPGLQGLGQVARARGDLVAAQDLGDAALAAARACCDPAEEARALCELGLLAPDHRQAAPLLHQALVLHGRNTDPAGVADCLEALAGLAVEKANLDDAARMLGAAQSIRDAHRCVRSAVRAGEHAACLDQVCQGLSDEEFHTAWAQGEALSVEEAVAYASRRRGRRPRASSGWDALTASEHQVVDLVAEGLTNPEIAERLRVSPRTVQAHLSHVFAKLGVTSRTALAGEVMRRDS